MKKSRLLLLILGAVLAAHASCATIREVASGPLQIQASVSGVVTYLEPSECYVESADRSGGVRVVGPTTGLAIGSMVTATGGYDVIDGEPCLKNATITLQTGSADISPFGMPNAAITGPLSWLRVQDYRGRLAPEGWTYEWAPSAGAVNTGLLVRTWGKVNALYYSPVNAAQWFYLDDGFSAVSDYGDMGLIVYSDAAVNRGDSVSVTGVSSVEPTFDGTQRLVRVIRTRSAADVKVEKAAAWPQGPCSDEFDRPKLGPWWYFYSGSYTPGSYSLNAEPGWLALTLGAPQAPPLRGLPLALELTQSAAGGWSCEMKLRPDFVMEAHSSTQLVDVSLSTAGELMGFGYQYIAEIRALWNGQQVVRTVSPGGNGPEIPMQGDTCYLRVRRPALAGEMMYCSVSFDGLTYSEETGIANPSGQFLSIVPRAYGTYPYVAVGFTTYVDYVRFSPYQ